MSEQVASGLDFFLLRHAKSSWSDPQTPDHDRPLNARGERDAPATAERIKARGDRVARIFSSSARRALSTARHVAEGLGLGESQLQVERALYTFDPAGLQAVINTLVGTQSSLLFVGHNPAMMAWVGACSRDGVWKFPTCALARLRSSASQWSEVAPDNTELLWIDTPKHPREAAHGE